MKYAKLLGWLLVLWVASTFVVGVYLILTTAGQGYSWQWWYNTNSLTLILCIIFVFVGVIKVRSKKW